MTFKWKDYRADGATRHKTMTLSADEFMRRFLLHVLPSGFHRIRHYGLIANTGRRENLARARELLHVAPMESNGTDVPDEAVTPTFVCPDCGAAMIVIETLARAQRIRATQASRCAMNVITTRNSNSYRPEPIREPFAWRCKTNSDHTAPQRKIIATHFDTGYRRHAPVMQTGLAVKPEGRAATQIPIDRFQL